MPRVAIRLTEEEYEKVMQRFRATGYRSLQKFLVQTVIEGGGEPGEEDPLEEHREYLVEMVRQLRHEAEAYQRDLTARIVSESQRVNRLETRLDDLEVSVVKVVGFAAGNPALPPGMTHRPDPLAGLVPPVSESRVAPRLKGRGKKAKAEGCKRCEEGCVPDICCCGCHRKERAA